MRRLIGLLCLGVCCFVAVSAQEINAEYKKVPLSQVLTELNAASDEWRVMFMVDELEHILVSAKVKDATLPEAVEKVTEGQPVKVKVKDNTIFVQYQKRKDRKISLMGHVKDSFTKVAIPNVHITLMRSDYTVIDTVTVGYRWNGASRNAWYRFEVPAVETDYVVLAQHPEYEDCYVDYACRHIVRNTMFNLPDHQMVRKKKNALDGGELNEVVVKATRVQFMFRGDTLVYNADAFNIPEGSMLDGLIRQLPGTELTRDGEIYVNGRKIDNLLLNGKDFLKGNNKVLLENLPYYTVKELQVYDRETALNKYLGRNKEPNEYVMDVVLKREYQRTGMGNVLAGAGTDGRYKEQIFGLLNAEHSRYGIMGSMNNINEQASSSHRGITDSFDPTGETRQVGFTLPAIWENREGTLSDAVGLTVAWNDANNRSRTLVENYLASGNTFQHGESSQKTHDFSLELQNHLQVKSPFIVTSVLHLNYRRHRADGLSESLLASDELLTDSVNLAASRSRDKSTDFRLSWENFGSVTLPTGDDAEVTLNVSVQRQTYHQHAWNQYRYFKTDDTDFRHQYDRLPSTRWDLQGTFDYEISFLNGFSVAPFYTLQASRKENTNDYYRLDRLEEGNANVQPFGWLPSTADSLLFALDLENANAYTSTELAHNMGVNLHYNIDTKSGRNYQFRLDLIPVFEHRSLDYRSSLLTTMRKQDDWTYWAKFYYEEYNKTGGFVSRVNLTFSRDLPDLLHAIDIPNTTNPLNVRLGNPDLKSSTTIEYYITRRLFENREMNRNVSLALGGQLTHNAVANGYTYNAETGVRTYRPENIHDNKWNLDAVLNASGKIDKKFFNVGQKFRLRLDRSIDLAALQNRTETDPYSHVFTTFLGYSGNLTYTKEALTLTPAWGIDYQHIHRNMETDKNFYASTFQPFNSSDLYSFHYGLSGNYTFPLGINLETDITMHSRRGFYDPTMNDNQLLWNATLTRSFLPGGRLTARLRCYDILNRISNYSYTTNAQAHTETWHNTLHRYLLLTLQYKLNFNPKKKP